VQRKTFDHAFWPGLVVMIVLCTTAVTAVAATERNIPYRPEFLQLVQQGRIRHVEIASGSSGINRMRATLAAAEGKGEETVLVDGIPRDIPDDQIVNMLIDKGVSVTRTSGPGSLVSEFFPALPLLVVYVMWPAFLIVVLWLGFRLVRAVEQVAANTKK